MISSSWVSVACVCCCDSGKMWFLVILFKILLIMLSWYPFFFNTCSILTIQRSFHYSASIKCQETLVPLQDFIILKILERNLFIMHFYQRQSFADVLWASCSEDFHKNMEEYTRAWVSFSIRCSRRLLKEFLPQVFSCEFCKMFQITFFAE